MQKKGKVSKEVRNPNDKNALLLSFFPDLSGWKTNAGKIPADADERTWALYFKKKKANRKEIVDYFIFANAIHSPLCSLSHASLLSPCSGVPDLFPHCQIANGLRTSCQVARFALPAADWTALQSRRPAREGREAGEEPPVSQFHAWPNKVNRVDDVTGVQLRRRWNWVSGRSFQGCRDAIGCRRLSVRP